MSKTVVIVVGVIILVLGLPYAVKAMREQDTSAATVAVPTQAAPTQAAAPVPITPGAPAVVTFDPPNGGTGISPSLKEIRVTFSVPMAGGFSWTGGGPNFPGSQGQKPYWTPDKKTCVLPVTLKPNWSYQCGLNSPSFKNFKAQTGIPLDPVVYTFSTGS